MATQTSPKMKQDANKGFISKSVVDPVYSHERLKNDGVETMKMQPHQAPKSKSKVGPGPNPTELHNQGSQTSQLSQVRKAKKVEVTRGRSHSMANWMKTIKTESLVPVASRVISTEELLTHNTRTDCWMALKGKVFDVTSYGDYHPGGVAYIMKGAGVDASKIFNNVHNYVDFESILKGRQVGIYMSTTPEKDAKGGGCCGLCK